MSEVWKDVPGYEGLYQVSDQGRVKSLARIVPRGSSFLPVKERILRPGLSHGYPMVILQKNGESWNVRVHILVMLTFVGPRPEGLDVCHGDGNRLNARLKNLRYGTRQENLGDAVLHGTMAGENNGNSKLTGKNVSDILSRFRAFEDQLAAEYGVSAGTIRNVKMGRTYQKRKAA